MTDTKVVTIPSTVSVSGGPIEHWYRDTLSCMQTTIATLLIHAGEDPLATLGLAWDFLHVPGDFRPEEFYLPCRFPGDPVRTMLPYHDVSAQWRVADSADPLPELTAALADGRLPVIVTDNYHLPFRPAYHDLHSIHLLVVYDVDTARGALHVSDAQPPSYLDTLDAETLGEAWFVRSPQDDQDAFFTGARLRPLARWLDVRLRTPFPELDAGRLRTALTSNLDRFHQPAQHNDRARVGLAGLAEYTAELVEQAKAGDGDALVEAYTYGWGMQAQAALHGELLRVLGTGWRHPALAEAGRKVESVAHRWSALRVQAGHGRLDPPACAADLVLHASRLHAAHEEALGSIGYVVERLL